MSGFFISKRDYFTLIAAVILSLAILFNNDAPQIDAVRSMMVDLIAASQERFGWSAHASNSDAEVGYLRERATRLMLENSQLREAYLENLRLRRMLDLRKRSAMHYMSAKVVHKEIAATPNSVIINLGSEEGMKPNLPVVTPDGIAGKIFKVNDHTSHVQLMLDRNFSISARTQRSRVLGFVSWNVADGLIMTGVARNADVKAGDVVVTSDSSALYPSGIRIGIVKETAIDPASLFKSISLIPEVDFSSLEEVFVITSPVDNPSNVH